MGRRGKRHHGKAKGQGGGTHEKKKAADELEGSIVVKGKGRHTSPVPVIILCSLVCSYGSSVNLHRGSPIWATLVSSML